MNQHDSLPVIGTVVCLPLQGLETTRVFSENVFSLPELTVEEEIILVELPNLSLFLIQEQSFESYTRKAGRSVSYPGTNNGTGVILSCAIKSPETLDATLTAASAHGGSIPKAAATDPDGHHWELAHSNRS